MTKPRGIHLSGNWKMNNTRKETQEFFADLSKSLPEVKADSSKLRITLFVPLLSLNEAQNSVAKLKLPIEIGAQNAHWEKSGAFTGEVSGPMLHEAQVETVLVGHSERRQYFGETNETVHKRARSLLNQGFRVLLCVGETLEQRKSQITGQILVEQLSRGLPSPSEVSSPFLNGRLMLAYEPVWAIGTGLTATPEQAEEAHQIIRQYLEMQLGPAAAESTPILYGGSVTSENIDSLLACPNIDGALVGGASLKPAGIAQMTKTCLRHI